MENVFTWFNVTVEFITEDEQTGKIKKIKEEYLVKAVSPTDVDVQMTKELDGTLGEYSITGMKKSKIVKIIHPDNIGLNS